VGQFFAYVPQLIGAIVILIIGYIVARILQTVVARVLQAVRCNRGDTELRVLVVAGERSQRNAPPLSMTGG
jgi:mechanosensitive ion channel-like protein